MPTIDLSQMHKNFPLAVFALLGASLVACSKQEPSTAAPPSAEAPNAAPASQPQKAPPAAAKIYDGPFGLAAGISAAELKAIGFEEVDSAPGIYRGKPPKPFSDPGEYVVLAAPKAGLCRIRATFDVNNVNGAGDQIRSKVDQLAETMQIKYGKHSDKVNYISRDVYRRNPEFWMMGLKEESVMYGFDWTAGKTQQPMPQGLSNIEIVAVALDGSSGMAAIHYNFDNRDECMKELKEQKSSAL
ncbi:hypothetical protein [Massilia timonae]|nr:hypothetical protein [Massilia timonae]